MIKMIKMLSLLLIMILFCLYTSSYADGAYEQMTGRYIEHEKVDALIEGESRKEKILELLGDPLRYATNSNGAETLEYASVRKRRSHFIVLWVVPLVTYTTVLDEQVSFTVTDGVLKNKSQNDSVNSCVSPPIFDLFFCSESMPK
ncbi:MAG: hypothetical protein KJ017_06470 [Alphaproteobacteria bacterium]|nr:hypothetical protein [Alphaproteobacteria bacterium]